MSNVEREPDWSEHDGRPAEVPGWVPSMKSLEAPFPASIINMKANITGSKSTRDKVIEGAFVVTEGIAFLMVILGLVPGYLPYNLSRWLGLGVMVLGAFYFLAAVALVGARLSFLPSPLKYQDVVGNDGAQSTRLVKNGVYGHCRCARALRTCRKQPTKPRKPPVTGSFIPSDIGRSLRPAGTLCTLVSWASAWAGRWS
jgi:hypothetical protein